MLVKRTGARVLPVVIDGTPDAPTAWDSLWTSSNARVRVMSPIDYAESGLGNAEIAQDLERRFIEWTGWDLGARSSRQTPADETPDESPADDTHGIADGSRQIA